jgi:penicillin-binding protein
LYSSIISSTEDFSSEIQLADSGFGQGQILMNPIHLAVIYASFVNDGNILRPQLISTDFTPDVWIENAFTPETASIIRKDLIQVVERGTATRARIPGITLAGKTGTAEIKQSQADTTGTELGWFIMFTADDNADNQLLVVSMVEDVKNRGGSHYVVPRVKSLFE